jgi:electron transfer flavoprotein-quinone oxidoreductase
VEAFKKKDFSAASLALYDEKLKKSAALKDLKQFRKAGKMLEHNPKLFDKYPRLMEELVSELFAVDGEPKWPKEKRLIGKLLKSENIFSLIKTALDMRRIII